MLTFPPQDRKAPKPLSLALHGRVCRLRKRTKLCETAISGRLLCYWPPPNNIKVSYSPPSAIPLVYLMIPAYSYWAKDLLFVINDGYLGGMHAFLSAYHGVKDSSGGSYHGPFREKTLIHISSRP